MTPTSSSSTSPSYLPVVVPRPERSRCQMTYTWFVVAQFVELGVLCTGVGMTVLSDFKISMIGTGIGIAGILSFALTTLKSFDYLQTHP